MKKYVIPGLLGFVAMVGLVGLVVGFFVLGSWIDDFIPKWLSAWIIMGLPLGIFGAIGAIRVSIEGDEKKAEEESK